MKINKQTGQNTLLIVLPFLLINQENGIACKKLHFTKFEPVTGLFREDEPNYPSYLHATLQSIKSNNFSATPEFCKE
jgi:hypothetical protein